MNVSDEIVSAGKDCWANGKVFVCFGTIGVDYMCMDHSIGGLMLAEDV